MVSDIRALEFVMKSVDDIDNVEFFLYKGKKSDCIELHEGKE